MNPHATNHPISWFKKFEVDNSLDLSPKFQRRPVWSDTQASYLIDSKVKIISHCFKLRTHCQLGCWGNATRGS